MAQHSGDGKSLRMREPGFEEGGVGGVAESVGQ